MGRQEDQMLIQQLKKGNERAFEALFHHYYPYLCQYATQILKNDEAAEEVVQELFVRLWEKRDETTIQGNVKNYLFRAARNNSLNYLKHKAIRDAYVASAKPVSHIEPEDDAAENDELFEALNACIEALPEKRREIFRLSRQKGMKYHEIARELNISVKTVETQIGLAIKTLRKKLQNRLSLFL
jgi:RNA polymerase sigma-70 factor (ECF subfamily)